MSPLKIIGLSFLSLGLAACSTTTDSGEEPTLEDALKDKRVGEKTDRLCFTRGISGFRSWDGPDGLILKKGAREEYLVLVTRSCQTVERAQRIGVDNRFGSGCISRGDYLYISETVFPNDTDPFSTDRCLITAIYKWNEDAGDDTEEE